MQQSSSRVTLAMNEGWRFHLGDVSAPPVDPRCVYAYHCMSKSNRARGAAVPYFDDSDWEIVRTPHDYVIDGEVAPAEPSAHASLARPNAWYRMAFSLEEGFRDRRAILEFDGVATRCEVWVNGHLLCRHFGAYIGFEVDFTDVAVYGDEANTVAVYVDAREFEGWWYEGGGIYRPVRLVLKNQRHIERWGVYAKTQRLAQGGWVVKAETSLRNMDFSEGGLSVRSEVLDGAGQSVASAESVCVLEARGEQTLCPSIPVGEPALWSPNTPNLYTLRTRVYEGEREIDRCDTTFGFRTLEFSARGMRVNGEPLKIRGACVHEDYGALGVAMPDPLREYRLKKLMQMGVNGIRCSHNPQSSEQLELCDRLGLMVMDETRWFESYGEGLSQLRDMIRRDRNHPSVFFWSMGNEEPCQRNATGGRIMRAMRAEVRKLDDTRPCLMAMHTGLLDGGAAAYHDVIGMNYNEGKLEQVHARFPDRAIVGSEMYSTSLDPEGDRSLGLYTCEMLDKLDYLIGIYIWTGMDYRGEHIYPSVVANAGAIDLNCQPRDDFYLYQALWTAAPMVHIHTHWNHRPGEEVEVFTYTNLDAVELFLNGRSLGVQRAKPFEVGVWRVPFEAGELRAVAVRGAARAEHCVRTAGKPARLRLSSELGADAGLVVVNMVAADADGLPCLNSDDEVSFEVLGGALLGACNGDIFDHTKPKETLRPLYKGFCQLVIRPEGSRAIVRARLRGSESAELALDVAPAAEKERVLPLASPYLTGWRQSGIYDAMPDVLTLDPKAWKPLANDILTSWNFYDYRPIDKGAFVLDAWMAYYADAVVPEGKRGILFGEYPEGTRICIGRSGGARNEYILEAPDRSAVFFDTTGFSAGERLEIFVLLHAVTPHDGLNGPVSWR